MQEPIKLNRTQRRVFEYMLQFGSITTLQAFADLGESRLSARIWELRHKGVNASSQLVKVSNRFGESRWVKEYKIG